MSSSLPRVSAASRFDPPPATLKRSYNVNHARRRTTRRKGPITVFHNKRQSALIHNQDDLRGGSNEIEASSKKTSSDKEILVWIRLLFLCYYGSLGALLPYLPVYYDSIGHGGEIIGLLGAVKPATTFLVAPLWGLIADAADRPFSILQLTFAVSLAGQLGVSYSSDAAFIMVMVFLTALFNAPVKSLLDSMVLEQLSDQSSYGRLRLWGQMGFGLGSSAVGILLSRYSKQVPWPDTHSFSPWFQQHVLDQLPHRLQSTAHFLDKCWQTLTGYKILFFAHAALSLPTWICIQKFRRLNHRQQQQTEQKVATIPTNDNDDKKKNKNKPAPAPCLKTNNH